MEELPCKKLVLVVYGDTTGFSSWSRRVEDDAEQFLRYMKPLSRLFSSLKDSITTVKKFGDGCMFTIEVDESNFVERAIVMLKKCIALCRGVKAIRQSMHHPRPADFRIRGLCGPAWKWRDENEAWDYYSKTMNDGRHLLSVSKESRIIIHENVIERIPRSVLHKHKLIARKMGIQPDPGQNLDKEDLALLHQVIAHGCSKGSLPVRRKIDRRQRKRR